IVGSWSATEDGDVVGHVSAGERARIVLSTRHTGDIHVEVTGTATDLVRAPVDDALYCEIAEQRSMLLIRDASYKIVAAKLVTRDGLVDCDFGPLPETE